MSELDLRDRISAPLNCTNCRQVVTVSIDRHATGNLTVVCPRCGHEHYRYVENGVITEDRWRSSAQTISYSSYSTSATSSTCSYATSTAAFLQDAWFNTSSSGTGG